MIFEPRVGPASWSRFTAPRAGRRLLICLCRQRCNLRLARACASVCRPRSVAHAHTHRRPLAVLPLAAKAVVEARNALRRLREARGGALVRRRDLVGASSAARVGRRGGVGRRRRGDRVDANANAAKKQNQKSVCAPCSRAPPPLPSAARTSAAAARQRRSASSSRCSASCATCKRARARRERVACGGCVSSLT